jgi:hypothetical protein
MTEDETEAEVQLLELVRGNDAGIANPAPALQLLKLLLVPSMVCWGQSQLRLGAVPGLFF